MIVLFPFSLFFAPFRSFHTPSLSLGCTTVFFCSSAPLSISYLTLPLLLFSPFPFLLPKASLHFLHPPFYLLFFSLRLSVYGAPWSYVLGAFCPLLLPLRHFLQGRFILICFSFCSLLSSFALPSWPLPLYLSYAIFPVLSSLLILSLISFSSFSFILDLFPYS